MCQMSIMTLKFAPIRVSPYFPSPGMYQVFPALQSLCDSRRLYLMFHPRCSGPVILASMPITTSAQCWLQLSPSMLNADGVPHTGSLTDGRDMSTLYEVKA